MEKFTQKNMDGIKSVIQDRCGVKMHKTPPAKRPLKRCVLSAACLVCFMALSAFAYYKFNCLTGDNLALNSEYKGGGKFEITVDNLSDHELRLQDKVKVMRWSTGEAVEGDPERIHLDGGVIEPHSTGTVTVDISDGYDVEAMKKSIGKNDWYYFVLTNNDFAFGQDWGCAFEFENEDTDAGAVRAAADTPASGYETGEPAFDGWVPPAVPLEISQNFGAGNGGRYSDHINIAGSAGDPIFAVCDGTVTDAGFDGAVGNYLVLAVDGGAIVKYGHLKEINVSVGDAVRAGDEIASMGMTGSATGANLYFAVNMNGENVDPIKQ